MKKYKLIKEYPDSPELGTIVNENGQLVSTGGYYSYSTIGYPEFWQEVIEKDYEILSYKHNDGRISISTTHSETYNMSLLATQGVTIYSVKRLSDGEIFTIGDEVKHRNVCNRLDSCNILDIYIAGNQLFITTANFNTNICMLDKITKKPLFTTEDGIDIYDVDDIVYGVRPNYTIWETGIFSISKYNDYKFYSTEEAAKEYILMNKPCLSVNDLMKAASITYCNLTALKKLVKSKL